MLTINDLFTLDDTIAAPLFAGKTYAWEVLDGIADFIRALGPTLPPEEYDHPAEDVWVAKDAKVFPSACRASSTTGRRSATAPSSAGAPSSASTPSSATPSS